MKSKKILLILEGPDGSGKTSLVPFIEEALKSFEYAVMTRREPGGTALGEKIRELIVRGGNMNPLTERLLFAADHSETVFEINRKCLEAVGNRSGNLAIVVDRWSPISEQLYTPHAYTDVLSKIREITPPVYPNLDKFVLLFGVDPDEQLKRIQARGLASRFELDSRRREICQAYNRQRFVVDPGMTLQKFETTGKSLEEVKCETLEWLKRLFSV